jgi:hypothetical protein
MILVLGESWVGASWSSKIVGPKVTKASAAHAGLEFDVE